MAQIVKNLAAMQETWVQSLGQEDPLDKGMATHSSILAQRIPWTERSLVSYSPWKSLGKDIGMRSQSLLQGIFLTQGSNPGLPYCRQILYCLSHKGSPRITKWVAYPFSRGSSPPWDRTQVSHTAGRFFTV